MLGAIQKFFAWKKRERSAAEGAHERHLAWDRACRARGMTAREQADELQVRGAWLRLHRKASAKVLRNPTRRARHALSADGRRWRKCAGGRAPGDPGAILPFKRGTRRLCAGHR